MFYIVFVKGTQLKNILTIFCVFFYLISQSNFPAHKKSLITHRGLEAGGGGGGANGIMLYSRYTLIVLYLYVFFVGE